MAWARTDFRLTIDRVVAILPAMGGMAVVGKIGDVDAEHAAVVRTVPRREADAAVAARSQHFPTTMHPVEPATPRISEASDTA